MSVKFYGLGDLQKEILQSPSKLQRQTILAAQKLSTKIAGLARAGCPVDTGQTRNSIQFYVEVNGSEIEGGARSNYPVAVYQELGTGPVGAASGHPAASSMGISYRPDGWVYQSPKAAAMRGEEYVPGVKGGYVYTRGVPAKAFMYNAMVAMEDEIMAELGGALEEALK